MTQEFKCPRCDKRAQAPDEANPPQCCEQPMVAEPLDQCTLTSTPEHSRLDDPGDPCDDGRAG
jgi:hypothetical protein